MVWDERAAGQEPMVPDGWTVRRGFGLPASPWDLGPRRWIGRGSVHDTDTAGAALVARTRGVGLVVRLDLAGSARHRFLEDLEKLGPVQAATDPVPAPVLTAAQGRMLDLLAAGATTTSAAAELAVSRRTAHRLLADARRRLGVATTAEAVVLWVDELRGA